MRDHFDFSNWSDEAKRKEVAKIIYSWMDAAGSKTTVGDVSLGNTPLMREARSMRKMVIGSMPTRFP